MEKFIKGDLVQLKSGGPTMTIVGIANRDKKSFAEAIQEQTEREERRSRSGIHDSDDNEERYGFECCWFSGDKPMSRDYPSEALLRVKANETGNA